MLKIRVKYFFKRFSLYFIYGVIASSVPFFYVSMLFGLPAVLLSSVLLALSDSLNLKEADNVPKVFTTHHIIGIFVLTILVAVILLLLFNVF